MRNKATKNGDNSRFLALKNIVELHGYILFQVSRDTTAPTKEPYVFVIFCIYTWIEFSLANKYSAAISI